MIPTGHFRGSAPFYFSIPRPGKDAEKVRCGGFATKGEAKSEGEPQFNEATREGIDVTSQDLRDEAHVRWKAAPKPHGGYNKRAEIRAFRARLKAE